MKQLLIRLMNYLFGEIKEGEPIRSGETKKFEIDTRNYNRWYEDKEFVNTFLKVKK